TGFYVLLVGDHTPEGFAPVLEATLRDLLAADGVPAANEVQCGWGAHHSLEGAQAAARAFLEQRSGWEQVSADCATVPGGISRAGSAPAQPLKHRGQQARRALVGLRRSRRDRACRRGRRGPRTAGSAPSSAAPEGSAEGPQLRREG